MVLGGSYATMNTKMGMLTDILSNIALLIVLIIIIVLIAPIVPIFALIALSAGRNSKGGVTLRNLYILPAILIYYNPQFKIFEKL